MNYLMQHTTITHSRGLIILNVFRRFLYTIFSRNISLHQNPMLVCPYGIQFTLMPAYLIKMEKFLNTMYACMYLRVCRLQIFI